jgi:hypothetical protein
MDEISSLELAITDLAHSCDSWVSVHDQNPAVLLQNSELCTSACKYLAFIMASSPGSSTNAPMPDFAFNSSLIGYDVGIPGRQLEHVIRISTAHAMNSKQAGETFAALEWGETDAGKEWSHAELAIAGCEKAELAVVVGVLLPQAAIATLPNKPLTPAVCENFDQEMHCWVPTNEKTWIVVRKLSDQRGNLFALANKNTGTGLCAILPLPTSTTYRHRFFFFREWTGLSKATGQHRLRFNPWKANINKFAKRYGGGHGNDLADEVAPAEPVGRSPVDHPRDNETVLRNLLQEVVPLTSRPQKRRRRLVRYVCHEYIWLYEKGY